jgi:hypothetical protein
MNEPIPDEVKRAARAALIESCNAEKIGELIDENENLKAEIAELKKTAHRIDEEGEDGRLNRKFTEMLGGETKPPQ